MGFMGGGGGGGQQTSSNTTVQELAPEQKRLLGLVFPEAERISASPPQLFPGSTIAGFDPLQTQAQTQLLGQVAPGGTVSNLTQGAAMGNQFLTSGAALFPESNPALQSAIEAAIRPLTRSFEQTVLPGIRGGAIEAGQFGGSRQGVAEGIASQALLTGIGDVSATVQNEAYQNALDAMSRAQFATSDLATTALFPAISTEAVGAQRQQMEQALLSEEAQRFMAEQLIPFSVAQDIAALAFGIPAGQTTSTGTFPGPQGAGGLQSLLGGAASLATIAGMMFGVPFLGG